MLILGIESSCDDTGAAILEIDEKNNIKVLANIVSSQITKHKAFGGVVPQLAAKLHQENFIPVLEKAFKKAGVKKEKIDLIAVTEGPGLIPALLVGVSMAKTLACKLKKPLVGVNHMEGHIVSSLLETNKKQKTKNKKIFQFPALALLVSGGNTQLVLMREWLEYEIIGETRDDAAGEAFDKVGKMLGISYPAGARIEELAKKGNAAAYNFPRPMIKSADYDFSFSGLKTSVKNTIEELKKKNKKLSKKTVCDISASFQTAVIEVLAVKSVRAAKEFGVRTFIVGGGVSANQTLCNNIKKALREVLPDTVFLASPKEYANDNAAMIALAGYFRMQAAPRPYRLSSIHHKSGQTGKFGDWEKVQANAKLKLE